MKSYKPTTKSRRQMTNVTYHGVLTTDKPEKSLTHGFRRSVGRNSQGRITTRHKGSGHKRLYRDVDFKYDKKDIENFNHVSINLLIITLALLYI